MADPIITHTNLFTRNIFLHYFNDQMLANYGLTERAATVDGLGAARRATFTAYLLTDNYLIIPTIDLAQSTTLPLLLPELRPLLLDHSILFSGSETTPAQFVTHKNRHFISVPLYADYVDPSRITARLTSTSRWWTKRTISTTADLSLRWRTLITSVETGATSASATLARRALLAWEQCGYPRRTVIDDLHRIPERLGGQAFLLAILLQQQLLTLPVEPHTQTILEILLGHEWIASHFDEYNALLVNQIPSLGPLDCGISLDLPHRVLDLRHLHAALDQLGIRALLERLQPEELVTLKHDPLFQLFKHELWVPAYVAFAFGRMDVVRVLRQAQRRRATAKRRRTSRRPLRDVQEYLCELFETSRTDNPTGGPMATSTEAPAPKVGIIAALPIEYAALEALFHSTLPVSFQGRGAGRRYAIGQLPAADTGNHTVAIALADVGNNIAASRATLLLEHFPSVEVVIMCGIAGAVPNRRNAHEHVRLGDIVVSDTRGVVQYDNDKETVSDVICRAPPRAPSARLTEALRLLRAHEYNRERPWFAELDALLARLQWARPDDSTDVLTNDGRTRTFPHPHDDERIHARPRLFLGPIASANKLLRNPQRRDKLRDTWGVRAIEMEGSGIADAAWYHDATYFVIRGTCDYCDGNKNDLWHGYAAAVAASFCAALLKSMPSWSR